MTATVERRGRGEPVVLVHGLGSRWEVFEPILDRVAERREVIAVDLPGFGTTPADPDVDPSPAGYARWLSDLLDAQGVDRPHIVGSSMGGGIALELGRIGRASRVTAFSPVGFWRPSGVRWCQGLLTSLRAVGRVSLPLLERTAHHEAVKAALVGALVAHPSRMPAPDALHAAVGLVGAQSFAGARDSFTDYRFDHQGLGHLTEIPVTIAWGTRDVVLTHATQSRRARAALSHARHIDLPGCGHLPFTDDPERCAALVLDDPREWR